MNKTLKKRSQKISKKITLFGRKISENSKEHVKENLIGHISHVKNVRLFVLEWVLLILAILLFATVQSVWYSESYAVETYTDGGNFTEGTLGKINSMNPLFATTFSEEALSRLMFARLAEIDYSGHTGAGLAETITSNATGDEWTVRLRQNLKWSDGDDLTTEDVLYTVNTIKSASLKSNFSNKLNGVTVRQSEDGSLVFKLENTNAFFESNLNFPILPAHILKDVKPEQLNEHKMFTKPISSGSFVFKATQTIGNEGEKIVYLNRNQNYYKGKTLLDSFSIHAFLTTDAIKASLKSGSITATGSLPSRYTTELLNEKSLKEQQTTVNYGVFAFLNTTSTSNTALQDKAFRQALRQGLNYGNLLSGLNGEQALKFPITEQQAKTLSFPEAATTNVTEAKSKLDNFKANKPEYFGTDLRIVTVKGDKYMEEIANRLAEQLKSLGVPNQVAAYEASQDFTLNVLRPRNYDILIYEIAMGADPDVVPYYHSAEATENGYNLSNYKNATVSNLILSARNTIDTSLRDAKYRKFLEIWLDEVPSIALYQSSLPYFMNKNVRAFSADQHLVSGEDRFNDIINWSVKKTFKNRTP